MPSFLPGRSGRKLSVTLSVIVLLAAACGASGRGRDAAAPTDRMLSAAAETLPVPAKASRFAVEEALGADCSRSWISEPPMQNAACYGLLPAHVADFLRTIPDSHPHLDAEFREELAATKQRFVFVEGYGERPDVLASIFSTSAFWIRSFEGPDPDVTVYVVFGPACDDDPRSHERGYDEGCLPGYPAVMRDIRIYRVRQGGAPEDVTTELAPPPPVLTVAERKRYGIYLRPPEEGGALDTDVGLNVYGLDTTPVMRWVIAPREEGDYEKPYIPDSDPRGFYRRAHFGFLVWTGERFELRKKIPEALWLCGIHGLRGGSCPESDYGDPYLTRSRVPGVSP